MKLKELAQVLDAKFLCECGSSELDVNSACGADLMSDVMAFAKENIVLLTGLVNQQVIRTAEMMDIKVVVFVRGKNPGQAIVDLASEKGITVLATDYPMYIACGRLYSAGLTGSIV